MTPPLYRYVKGQGWVLTPEPQAVVVTMACGTKVTLEMRRPLPGEYWDYGGPETLEQWTYLISTIRYGQLCKGVPADHFRGGHWCTVIPVLAP